MTEIHTLAYGDPPWMQRCLPSLRAYASRHACILRIWDEAETCEYPSPKFILQRILQEFLKGSAAWCVWIDADVWIHDRAPLLVNQLAPGFHIAVDPSENRQRKAWYVWCQQHKWRPGVWRYRNAGVWCCDRETACRLLPLVQPPFYVGLQEQHHLNWWLQQLSRKGGQVPELSRVWNAGVPPTPLDRWHGGWFIHLLSRKAEKLQEIDRLGGFERLAPKS